MMPWIIFPDTLDVAEMATGKRPTGTYSGMMTLARKVAGALGVGMVGWITGAAGYVENTTGDPSIYIEQTDAALLSIKLVLGIAIAVFISVSLFASFKYKVTSKKLERMRYFIEARKGGAELSPEEEEERANMVAELYGKVNPNDIIDPVLYDEEGNLKVSPEEEAALDSATDYADGIDAFAQAEAESVLLKEAVEEENSDDIDKE